VGVYPAPRHAASTAGGVARRAARFASLYNRGTTRGEPLGTIRIPRIGLKMVFVQGTGAAQLRQGPAHYVNTSMPGQPGTVGIAGHRTTYLAPFHDLDQLRRGDPIELDTPYGTFTYAVEGQAVVAPTYVNILDPSWTTQRLVLTSCHPLRSAAERIVVVARLRNMKVI
jgi:sortase A